MKKNLKLKGQLKSYMQWPIMLTVLLVLMNIWIYTMDVKIGMVMSFFTVIYAVVVTVLYVFNKPLILNELISFATQYGQVQRTLLKELAVPYALLDDQGKIIWKNQAFSAVVGAELSKKKSLFAVFPEIHKDEIPSDGGTKSVDIHFGDRDYRADMRKIDVESMLANNSIVDTKNYDGFLMALYLFDVTELNAVIRENRNERMVSALIYIDNYDEALDSIEEVRQSLLVALIDRKINQYLANCDGLVKKMEKDKYFFVVKKHHFESMEQKKFSILEDAKSVNIGNTMPVTLSMGMGLSSDTYSQSYNYARVAIDLALARGGD